MERSTGRKQRSRSRRQPSRQRRHRPRSRESRHSRSRSRHTARRRPARSSASSTARVVCHRLANQSAGDLAREFRNGLMGKLAFLGFTRTDFAWAARSFWPNGYPSVDDVRDMGARECEMFLSQVKSGHDRSRKRLSDMRLIFRIFAWFGRSGKLRDSARGGEEIDINRRMRTWSADLATITGPLHTEQDMANFFSGELERGRLSRPPYTPYVATDSLAFYPWHPPGEPHTKTPSANTTPVFNRTFEYRPIIFPPAMGRAFRTNWKLPFSCDDGPIPHLTFRFIGHWILLGFSYRPPFRGQYW